MSKLSEFIKEMKKAEVKEEVKEESKESKPVYVAKRPHAKSRERNERFREFVKSDEAKELIN